MSFRDLRTFLHSKRGSRGVGRDTVVNASVVGSGLRPEELCYIGLDVARGLEHLSKKKVCEQRNFDVIVILKGAVSRYSVIVCPFFARATKWLLPVQVSWTSVRSAARTTSPPQLSRANVIFLEQLSCSTALPCGRHFFPHKMAAKNHWLSWHCRFKSKQPLRFRSVQIFSTASWSA